MTHLLLPIVASVPGRRYAAVPVRRSHSRARFQENRGKQSKQKLVIHFLVLFFQRSTDFIFHTKWYYELMLVI